MSSRIDKIITFINLKCILNNCYSLIKFGSISTDGELSVFYNKEKN